MLRRPSRGEMYDMGLKLIPDLTFPKAPVLCPQTTSPATHSSAHLSLISPLETVWPAHPTYSRALPLQKFDLDIVAVVNDTSGNKTLTCGYEDSNCEVGLIAGK